MLLLFRFLLTILKAHLRRRIGLLDSSTVHFTALPHDCDLNLHLNSGRFISFMDIARVELLARMRVLRPALRRGWRPVMGGAEVMFRRSILPFERFSITSRVVSWDEKWFYIEHVAHRKDGSLSAKATMRTIIRGKSGNVPPQDVLALLENGK